MDKIDELEAKCAELDVYARSLPSLETLNEYFLYDEKIGTLTRKKTINSRAIKGNIINAKNDKQYIKFNFQKKSYYAHRIVWKMFYGEDPAFIDHINRNRSDNRIENLRSVPRGINNKNRSLNKNNTTGVSGIRFCNIRKIYVCTISVGGKNIYLGQSKNLEDLIELRKQAEIKYGYTGK